MRSGEASCPAAARATEEREREHDTENPRCETEGLDEKAPAFDRHLPATREVRDELLTLSIGRHEAVPGL